MWQLTRLKHTGILLLRGRSYQIELDIIIGYLAGQVHIIFGLMARPGRLVHTWIMKMVSISITMIYICIRDIDIHFMQLRLLAIVLDSCGLQ
jgi:hypothetical protein